MTCDQAHELLELSFGDAELPAELIRHLQTCESCSAYRAELAELSAGLGTDLDFELTDAEIERSVRIVNAEIAAPVETAVTPLGWLRPLIRVAAVVLVVAVSLATYQWGWNSGSSPTLGPTASATAVYDIDLMASLWVEDLEEDLMDDNMVSVLIDEYTGDSYFGAGESLIDDITEEEMEYLMTSFEVGELL